jgi:hypothetical protein
VTRSSFAWVVGWTVGLVAGGLEADASGAGQGGRWRCFVAAYPGVVCSGSADGLVLCDGTRISWDDGLGEKPYRARLNSPDLEDTVSMPYRRGRTFDPPPPDFEPGRWRHEGLMSAMYGRTRSEVAARTRSVPWMVASGGREVRVTTVNGAADALARVSEELEQTLPADLRAIAAKTAGVFVWRKVRGTTRQSPHSWATAIDVGVSVSDYWDWTKPDALGNYRWRNRFPLEIVEVFERHGFIWGGKWSHFDTMHFEYRPELLVAPCVDPR